MSTLYFVLPIFNEDKGLEKLLEHLIQLPLTPHLNRQIIAVNDGSSDNSLEVLHAAEQRYPLHIISYHPNRGIPTVFLKAFEYLRDILDNDDIVVIMESDGTSDLGVLPSFVKKIEEGADIVIGSRCIPHGAYLHFPFHRMLGSVIINLFLRFAWKIDGATDYTIFYRAYRGALLKRYIAEGVHFNALKSFAANGELLLQLSRYTPRIAEVPLQYDYSLKKGKSKMKLGETIHEYLRISRLKKMQGNTTDTTPCTVCKNTQSFLWIQKNNYSLYHCRSCKLIFISPTPTQTVDIYTEGYFYGATGGFGYINYDEAKQLDQQTFETYLDKIALFNPPPGKLLDVGTATGKFLLSAKARGWDVAGTEISEAAAQRGREQGLMIQTGALPDTSFLPESFDVITLWDVFEHLPNPHDALGRFLTLLKPNGLLLLNLPDAGSVYARLSGRFWQLILPPEHIYLYNKKNLELLLKQYGFSVLQVTTIGKQFTPAYILQMAYTIRHWQFLNILSQWIRKTPINKLSIPINLHDNMFIVAQKKG